TCRIKVTGVVNSYSIGRKYGLLADFTELSDNEIIDAIQSSQCRLQSTKSTKKSITAAWNEAEISGTNVDGYQISIKKKGTSTWKSSTVTGTKKEFSSLKSKTKYLLRVRPYASVNVTRYYGKWSVIKTVKTK
ncbi:MAG: fibronectin type III domain-containing protein, partial [Candidatus Weimeria sp.]